MVDQSELAAEMSCRAAPHIGRISLGDRDTSRRMPHSAPPTLLHLPPGKDPHADLTDTVIEVLRVAEYRDLSSCAKPEMLIDDEGRRGAPGPAEHFDLGRFVLVDLVVTICVVRSPPDERQRVEIRIRLRAGSRGFEARGREKHDVTRHRRERRDLLIV